MKTILVIDDEFALVESLSDLLHDEGYRVVTASNGQDGLGKVISEHPDLVITDLMMPIFDGAEMVRTLRQMPGFRSLPVVMMSASQQQTALEAKVKNSKGVWFLAKPFTVDELLSLVIRLIGK